MPDLSEHPAAPSQASADPARSSLAFPVARARSPRWQRWALGVGAAVTLAIVAGFAGFALSQGSELDSRETAVIEAAARGDLEETRVSEGAMEMSLVRAPGESEGFLWMENLPALPEGKAYQAWFTEDFEEFEPSTVLGAEDGGQWVTADGALDSYLALALTVEDEGGAEEPSSAPVVVLELQRSTRLSEVPPFMRAAAGP